MSRIYVVIGKLWRKTFKKGFRAYYLLVFTIILLTIGTQSIVQYSLAKQSSDAVVINVSGRQRMLSQKVVKEFYNCKYTGSCEYGSLRTALSSLKRINEALQIGDEKLGISALDNVEIQERFAELKPFLDGIYLALDDVQNLDKVSLVDLRSNEEKFLKIMDEIVWLFQKDSEDSVANMMILEKYLALLSVIVVLIEIVFIVNPIIGKMAKQNKKLEEIAWHQSHAFANHVKNIKDHQYILGVEKNPERQKEIINFVIEELDGVQEVSQFMVKALKKA